jgi:transcriptional regulator with XRE-family HTH domain
MNLSLAYNRSQSVKEKSVQKTLEEIGQKLRELRKKKGYTSAETFAYDYDLPRVHYWRIEKGKVNITIKSLHKLLSIHKVSIDEFFSDRNLR